MLHDEKLEDIADLMSLLPTSEHIRSLIRRTEDGVRIDSSDDIYYDRFISLVQIVRPDMTLQKDILQYLHTTITEDGITWSTIIEYGTTLPFSKRIVEGVLRGGKTLLRTIQGAIEPSSTFHVTIQPGHSPRASSKEEIHTSPIIYLPIPNTRLKEVEPVRSELQVLQIDVRRHVCTLQSHYSRSHFDVFARGPIVYVDGHSVNLSQLCVWVWMRRFAIHEYITSIHTQLTRQTKRGKPVSR
jgi:hypothetical protein